MSNIQQRRKEVNAAGRPQAHRKTLKNKHYRNQGTGKVK